MPDTVFSIREPEGQPGHDSHCDKHFARLSVKDGDRVPRPSLRQQMVASYGTGSSLGDHRCWITVSGLVISPRRDQAKEASVQPHRIGTAKSEANVNENAGPLRHIRLGSNCDACPSGACILTTDGCT